MSILLLRATCAINANTWRLPREDNSELESNKLLPDLVLF